VLRGVTEGRDLLTASLVKQATVKKILAYRDKGAQIYNNKQLSHLVSHDVCRRYRNVPFFANDSSEGPEKTSR
jgi:hypothetical protein